MYIAIKNFHSIIAFFLLIFLLFAILYNAYSWSIKKPFDKSNKLAALLGMISVHTQFLLGLILYCLSPLGLSNISGEAMKNANSRFYMLEHPFTMILGLVLITIGYSKAMRLTDGNAKYKKIMVFYSLGLILFLSRIPWSTWL